MSSSTTRVISFLAMGTMLFFACKSAEITPIDRVSVSLNQSARLSSDVVVRVNSIQDSRCPEGVSCVWAGEADVTLALTKGTDSTTVRLKLGPDPKARLDSTGVSFGNQLYKVILREVNPYPRANYDGRPKTAVVQVTKL